MNIFLRELKANRKSLIIWCVITALFVLLGIAKFSAYYNNPDMVAVLNDLPKQVLSALNVQAFNLTTISGFYGLMFTYYALLLTIAAVMWGTDIITKEERDKTVEFSLTLPVTRARLVTSKTLAALVNCVALLIFTWVASIVSAAKYQPDAAFFKFLALCMLALFIMQMVFLAVGIFLGCAMKRYKLATSTAISLLLVTYFFSIITVLNSKLDFLKYFSPFKYFDPAVLLHQSTIDIAFVGLSKVIIVISMSGAYLSYSKRDLYI
jgi:ABC-2 type transport system permease protein